MRRRRLQLRLSALLLVVAVSAAALAAYVLLRPSKPKQVSAPTRGGKLLLARLMYDGDWNADPLAFTRLEPALHELLPAVKVCEAALLPGDPKLVYYPLLYLHGRGAVSFSEKDLAELTMHLDPGGGTLFADAACGDRAFDAGLRRLVGRLFPGNTLVPIPGDDELFSTKVGFDLSNSQRTRAAGGGYAPPRLEGVKINGRWAIIYSKDGIGCALKPAHGGGCKGYIHEDACKIGVNVLVYSTLP